MHLSPYVRPKLSDDLTELTDGRFVAVAADGNVEWDVTGCGHGSNEFVVDWRSALEGPGLPRVPTVVRVERGVEVQTVFSSNNMVGVDVPPRVGGRHLRHGCCTEQLINLGEVQLGRRRD